MYSFAQRADTLVIDEPLYAHYLSRSTVEHPGQEEIIASQETDGNKVMQKILSRTSPEIIFCKQMAHHLIQLNTDFLSNSKNLLFIRDPKAIINSYSKVIPNPTMEDIGIKMQVDLLNELKGRKADYVVIDSSDLLKAPSTFLKKLCKTLAIPFDEHMLYWDKGPRKEDGVWAKYWYANVHQSTEFSPYEEKEIKLSAAQLKLYNTCIPYYNELTNHKLTI